MVGFTSGLRSKKKRGPSSLSEQLDRQEKRRLIVARCSGMHTKVVKDLIEEVCVYDKCRYYQNVWNPISCMEFVTPAFTLGIPEHLENLLTTSSEVAVYAALFMTMIASAWFGGFGPSNAQYFNNRTTFLLGFCLAMSCFVANLLNSMVLRFVASTLARESDMLVFISKARHWHLFNCCVFAFGILGTIFSIASAEMFVSNGDSCLVEATGGSMGFMEWFVQWMLEDYPISTGSWYKKGEAIKNPWALKAEELNLARPSIGRTTLSWGQGIGGGVGLYDLMSSEDKEIFNAYKEFMHGHFELPGSFEYGCFGSNRNYLLIFLILLALLCIICYWFYVRNARCYWMIAPSPTCKNFFFGDTPNDPYDLTHAYKDFELRARIGAKLAARDDNGDGFIDAVDEAGGDSDWDEDENEDEGQNEGGPTALAMAPPMLNGFGASTPGAQMVFTQPPMPMYTNVGVNLTSHVVGHHFGAPAHEQSGIMSNTAGAVLGKEEVFNETVTVNSTARAELQAAGIDMAFHDLLLAAGLDLETLKMSVDDRLYLASELQKAGVAQPGDRIKILNQLLTKVNI